MNKQQGSVTPIRLLGDPVLRETSREVETFDALLVRLYEDMLETMYQAPGVGLAAPQIGLSLRFFVYDVGDGSGPGCITNPVLSEHGGSQTEDEGCLSIPKLYFPTERAESVRVDGLDVSGGSISIVGTGLLARIFQHETDHLNGMLFIDRLEGEVRREALAAIRDREFGAGSSPARRIG
jgi:peptide deformylase